MAAQAARPKIPQPAPAQAMPAAGLAGDLAPALRRVRRMRMAMVTKKTTAAIRKGTFWASYLACPKRARIQAARQAPPPITPAATLCGPAARGRADHSTRGP